MHIEIYSKIADEPEYRIEHDGRGPTWEGEVDDLRDLEDIFRYFNRVDEGDADRLEAIGYRLPSLSVGDIVTVDGNHHVVASSGFAEISAEDVAWLKVLSYTRAVSLARRMSDR